MGENARILIVDDIPENIQILLNMLKEDNYDISFAVDAQEAIEIVEKNDFDLILLDIMLPGVDGFSLCRPIKELSGYREVPVLFLTAKSDIDSIAKGFEAGGSDYITKPFHAEELLARVKTHLNLYYSALTLRKHNLSLEYKLRYERERLLSEMEAVQKEIIYLLTELIESASAETGRHVKRVAIMARTLASLCDDLSQDDVYTLYHAAPLHDIGKMLVPSEILHKPGPLTPQEREQMKYHASVAETLLSSSRRKIIRAASIVASQHHEWWDGSGYPKGLKGTQIHIYGRIMAIVDVFDALTHERVYKEAWPIEKALEYIRAHAGTQFDPRLVDLFIRHADKFVSIART